MVHQEELDDAAPVVLELLGVSNKPGSCNLIKTPTILISLFQHCSTNSLNFFGVLLAKGFWTNLLFLSCSVCNPSKISFLSNKYHNKQPNSNISCFLDKSDSFLTKKKSKVRLRKKNKIEKEWDVFT